MSREIANRWKNLPYHGKEFYRKVAQTDWKHYQDARDASEKHDKQEQNQNYTKPETTGRICAVTENTIDDNDDDDDILQEFYNELDLFGL